MIINSPKKIFKNFAYFCLKSKSLAQNNLSPNIAEKSQYKTAYPKSIFEKFLKNFSKREKKHLYESEKLNNKKTNFIVAIFEINR